MHTKLKWNLVRIGIILPVLALSHYMLLQVGLSALYPVEAVKLAIGDDLQLPGAIYGLGGTFLMLFCYANLLSVLVRSVQPLFGRRLAADD